MAAFIRKIDSLHGLIEVERSEIPPKVIYALININDSKDIENYVKMSLLPVELQESIREYIRKDEGKVALHYKTECELKNAR